MTAPLDGPPQRDDLGQDGRLDEAGPMRMLLQAVIGTWELLTLVRTPRTPIVDVASV
jgi:hypothetical protein